MTPIPSAVALCVRTLTDAGHAACPVGGCVRDLLLGRAPSDWDVATSALPREVMDLFPHTVPTGLPHGTVTVVLEDRTVEVTTFRAETGYSDGRHPDAVTFGVSLEEDLARRDFTVNAMALAPDGAVIDPFRGRADLERRLIRAVGDPVRRFSEDGLRCYRAVRFAAQLGFALEPATAAAIPPLAQAARRVAGERILAETEKILLSARPELMGLLLDCGLLDAPRHPDLTPLRGTEAAPEARWRSFCALTGFDITSLPTSRSVRAAVLHPERALIRRLALTGGDLMALGFDGADIGRAQLALARHIDLHPEDNTPEKLTALVRALR